jgi:hypothetical protein
VLSQDGQGGASQVSAAMDHSHRKAQPPGAVVEALALVPAAGAAGLEEAVPAA